MNKRLLLISPIAPNSLVGKGFYFRMPVLSLLKITALTPSSWDVTIVDEKIEPLNLQAEADLVGITTMTATAKRAYEIADAFRQRGIKVIMGGMHVSSLPDEALNHCDCVVMGEAEGQWPKVLNDFENGHLQKLYSHDGQWPSLAGQPLANWELYRPKGYLPVHFIETTRGCPWDCEFCSVTSAFGGKYRTRPLEEVMTELHQLRPFTGRFQLPNCVFFIDDNIFGNRAYAKELFARVAELKINWFSHASINIANDPELLKLCQQSGCKALLIGFETLSPKTMHSIGKKPNHPEHYLEIVRRIHDYGVGIDASFVFGFDDDEEGVFDRTLDFVHQAKIEIPYYSILTPYPGTRFFKRMLEEKRLLSTDWSLFDTSHVVYKPKLLSPDQLLDGYFRMLKDSFTWNSMFKRLWGTTAWWQFFWGMNYGFRRSVLSMLHHKNGFRTPELWQTILETSNATIQN